MEAIEGRKFGPYQIEEHIGEGGMATVYRAFDEVHARHVAIKVLSPYAAQETQFKTRFRRETEVLKGLRHENVMPILDWGEFDEYIYIVMPLMSEGTLRERMQAGPLPLTVVADVMHQMASALAFTHAHGVIHRDIKPSNILIDSQGKAILTDFGFARVENTSHSLTGSALIGTPAYMSPEQCRGEPAGPLSDQYSVGIILYQMVTGTLPYEADTPLGVVILHATETLPPPSDFKSDLPLRVEAVILKALEKEPKDRYPSVAALDAAFQAAVAESDASFSDRIKSIRLDRPTQVFDGVGYRIRRFLRRKNALRRLRVVLITLLLLLMAGGFWWGFRNGFFGDGDDPASGQISAQDSTQSESLLATISALSVLNAPESGTDIAPQEVETRVALTLAVLLATEEAQTPSATSYLEKDVIRTAQAAAMQTASAQPTATMTAKPPTATPKPPGPGPSGPADDSEKCLPNKPPGHPHYCTPSP